MGEVNDHVPGISPPWMHHVAPQTGSGIASSAFLHQELFVQEQAGIDVGVCVVPITVPEHIAGIADLQRAATEGRENRGTADGVKRVTLLSERLAVLDQQQIATGVTLRRAAEDVGVALVTNLTLYGVNIASLSHNITSVPRT